MGRGEAEICDLEGVQRFGLEDALTDFDFSDDRELCRLLNRAIELLPQRTVGALEEALCSPALAGKLRPATEAKLEEALFDYLEFVTCNSLPPKKTLEQFIRDEFAYTRILPFFPSLISVNSGGGPEWTGERWHLFRSAWDKHSICGREQGSQDYKSRWPASELERSKLCSSCMEKAVTDPDAGILKRYATDTPDPLSAINAFHRSRLLAKELVGWAKTKEENEVATVAEALPKATEELLTRMACQQAAEWYQEMTDEQRLSALYYGHSNVSTSSNGGLVILGRCIRACYPDRPWPDASTFEQLLYEAQLAGRSDPIPDDFPSTMNREGAAVVHLTARLFPKALSHYLVQSEQRDVRIGRLVERCYPKLYRKGERGVKVGDPTS